MSEVIVYRYNSYLTGRVNVAYEVSDKDGIFQQAHITTEHETEEYRVMLRSTDAPIEKIKRMQPESLVRYFQIAEEIQKLREEADALLMATATNGIPVTFDWMKTHQRPNIPIPEAFKSKKEINKLRKGSKVIIDTTLSSWHRWVGTVGKIRRFNPKYAVIEIEGKGQIRVPYAYLKPYNPESKAHAKESKRHAEIGHQTVQQFSKLR